MAIHQFSGICGLRCRRSALIVLLVLSVFATLIKYNYISKQQLRFKLFRKEGALLFNATLFRHNGTSKQQLRFKLYRKEGAPVFNATQNKMKQFLKLVSQLRMTDAEKKHMYVLIDNFTIVLQKNNISYVAIFGVLLGFARHGGLVPWDDDVDFLINDNYEARLEAAFAAEHKKNGTLRLFRHTDHLYKITYRTFTNVSHNTSRRWSWPYLDIFMAKDLGNHVKIHFSGEIMMKKDLYPLLNVPFGSTRVNIPRCFMKIVKAMYSLRTCCTGVWIHRRETWAGKSVCVSCNDLVRIFPFATHTPVNGSTTQMTIKLNDRIVRRENLRFSIC